MFKSYLLFPPKGLQHDSLFLSLHFFLSIGIGLEQVLADQETGSVFPVVRFRSALSGQGDHRLERNLGIDVELGDDRRVR